MTAHGTRRELRPRAAGDRTPFTHPRKGAGSAGAIRFGPYAAARNQGFAAVFCLAGLPVALQGQGLGRDAYYASLPPTPTIVSQTEASVEFALYGDSRDPNYSDVASPDGVDDRRSTLLLKLAEHFSPILRRNTLLVPREFEDVLGSRVVLHLDAWRDHVRVDSAALDLGTPVGATYASSPAVGGAAAAVAPDDVALLRLLQALSPRRPKSAVTPAAPPSDTILFFDVPGEDDFSWRPHHGRSTGRSRIYAHPFIHEVISAGPPRRYELIVQYWFYYPYNDAANNHEGDWEHISVSVTTRERAADAPLVGTDRGLLRSEDLERVLDPISPIPLDSLTIRNVAYYFHNNVMVVDYLAIAAGETTGRRAGKGDGPTHIWEDTEYMDEAVRSRLQVAGGRLSTHPIGYIGGNSKGMDELMQLWPRFLGSYNRDSHGTYPFPGVWRKVGPLDATEKIYGEVVPRLRLEDTTAPGDARPWHALIDDDRYLTYRAEDIILLPDWERLEPVVLEDAAARRRWAWFLLPVHMGYPASQSPGAGALKRVDLGNVAPMSPPYNSAWNRPAATAVYPLYEPTVLRVALAPISPLASLQSGWGILNLPIVLWGLLPGGNVAVTQLLPWITGAMHVLGSPPPKTFYLGELPERFTSISGGGFRQFGGDDFARLLPSPDHPEVRARLNASGVTAATAGAGRRESEWGSRVWLNLHYSSRLSIENSFGYSATSVSYALEDSDGGRVAELRGLLTTRELTGGVTYRLPPLRSEFVRLYARAGYGWTSYTLSGVTLGGRPLDGTRLRGGRLPKLYPSRSWWPNTGYGGLGVELFAPPPFWLFDRVGYGIRIETTGLLHRLDAGAACQGCRVTAERGDAAVMLLLGW